MARRQQRKNAPPAMPFEVNHALWGNIDNGAFPPDLTLSTEFVAG